MSSENPDGTVDLSSRTFLVGCVLVAAITLVWSQTTVFPVWILGAEVMLTIFGLFIFGSIRYRLDKNALTYGALIVVAATFWGVWWHDAPLRQEVAEQGWGIFFGHLAHYLFTLEGLDEIVHADTMLFLLGLTFFVAVISQTRLLESVSFKLLRRFNGSVVPTVAAITALVSLASGILDGVSMIGLTIRILVIILFLGRASVADVTYAVMLSTVVTTVCGMWLAYGEPPNLIMKSNLHPHLDDAFFLRYCAPLAAISFVVVAISLQRRFRGRKLALDQLDVLDVHAADVRFLQAERHGVVRTPVEFVESQADHYGEKLPAILDRLRRGEPLGSAMVAENVARDDRIHLLGAFVHERLAVALDQHYVLAAQGDVAAADVADDPVEVAILQIKQRRVLAQRVGMVAFVPFLTLLIWHAIDHDVRLFYASFAGFIVAFVGIANLPKMRDLALRDGWHEYKEYFFLFPLFLCITLLQTAGFFDQLAGLLDYGIATIGSSHVAWLQFFLATGLSALLDNNVVADFAARALLHLDIGLMHYFAMAQIAGYALGGCWTHVGCAQSVVAYSFIQRDVEPRFTPIQWIKAMTPILTVLFVVLSLAVYAEGWLLE